MTAESKNEALTHMLANRLRKRAKHLRKWARRYGTDCFRLYDRDIPEIPLVVEQYGQQIVVYNYADTENKREPRAWCPSIAAALNVDEQSIFWKVRSRQRGREQYNRLGPVGYIVRVHAALIGLSKRLIARPHSMLLRWRGTTLLAHVCFLCRHNCRPQSVVHIAPPPMGFQEYLDRIV